MFKMTLVFALAATKDEAVAAVVAVAIRDDGVTPG